MESKNVYLSNKELKSLRTKCPIIGRGTEGTLFYVGQGLVYKVYHDFENQINLQFPKIYDSEGVNISKISIKNHLQITPERYPLFYNEENVRLFKEEALENIKKIKFDLIISDYDMGNSNGLSILKYLRENNINTKFIMLTGSDSSELKEQVERLNAIFLDKGNFELLKIIRNEI